MARFKTDRVTVAAIIAVAVVVAAGGASVASNMGFKLNKPLALAGTSGQIGNNWTSVPYNNPYGNVGQFCSQTGLINTGITRTTVQDINPVTGATTQVTCGTAAANARPITPGLGIRIRQPAAGVSSIIVVGSHNPTLSITVPDAGTVGQVGNYWFAVPYHTTAVTANDLCLSSGLSSTGTFRATIQRLNAATGAFSAVSCGTAAAATTNLVLGEAIRIREPNGPKTFIPAHF